MEYREAAERMAALAICTEQVPVGCDQCPAYTGELETREQRKACNEMLAPEKIKEAAELIKRQATQ